MKYSEQQKEALALELEAKSFKGNAIGESTDKRDVIFIKKDPKSSARFVTETFMIVESKNELFLVFLNARHVLTV